MRKRTIKIEFDISYSRIDWLAKLLYNVCSQGDIKEFSVSGDDLSGVVVALKEEHIEAIANEAVTYHELEQKVIKMLEKD